MVFRHPKDRSPAGLFWRDGEELEYRAIGYRVDLVEPGVWRWRFIIGDKVLSGRTKAKLRLLAERRVRTRINRELK